MFPLWKLASSSKQEIAETAGKRYKRALPCSGKWNHELSAPALYSAEIPNADPRLRIVVNVPSGA